MAVLEAHPVAAVAPGRYESLCDGALALTERDHPEPLKDAHVARQVLQVKSRICLGRVEGIQAGASVDVLMMIVLTERFGVGWLHVTLLTLFQPRGCTRDCAIVRGQGSEGAAGDEEEEEDCMGRLKY